MPHAVHGVISLSSAFIGINGVDGAWTADVNLKFQFSDIPDSSSSYETTKPDSKCRKNRLWNELPTPPWGTWTKLDTNPISGRHCRHLQKHSTTHKLLQWQWGGGLFLKCTLMRTMKICLNWLSLDWYINQKCKAHWIHIVQCLITVAIAIIAIFPCPYLHFAFT